MEWTISINIIESLLLSWFISSLLDIKGNKWIYRGLLFASSVTLITISNFINMYDILLSTVVIIVTVIISSFFVSNNLGEILFICCLEPLVFCFSSSVSILLCYNMSLSILTVVSKCIYFVCGFIVIYFFKKDNISFDNKVYYGISIIVYVLHFLIQCLLQIYLVINVKTIDFLVAFILFILCMVLLFYVITYISKLYENKGKYERLLKEKENELILSHLYNDIKMVKHDLKHDFNLLQYYVDKNDMESIKELIKERHIGLDDVPSLIASKNDLINTIINNKLIEAYSKDLKVQCKISVKENIQISDYDLNQLLLNMLDNAIENCTKNGEISIQIVQEEQFLHIQVSNSITESAITKGFKTNKDKKYHGFGLKSIKNICQKYNAEVKMSEEEQQFIIETTIIL